MRLTVGFRFNDSIRTLNFRRVLLDISRQATLQQTDESVPRLRCGGCNVIHVGRCKSKKIPFFLLDYTVVNGKYKNAAVSINTPFELLNVCNVVHKKASVLKISLKT